MKKLFTLVALLACFLGAKAELVEVYSKSFSSFNGFPYYVMGYVPEWFDGVMTDFGAMYTYKTEAEDGDNVVGTVKTNDGTEYQKIQLESAGWHQYFIADGIPTSIDGRYKVVAEVKASEAVTINVNMGWGWGDGQQAAGQASIGTDWAEVEWEYSGIAGTSCNLVAQPGGSTATIEWKSIKVYEDKKQERPTTWQEWLNSDGKSFVLGEGSGKNEKYMGDAETPWADATVKFNDTEKNYLICAWSKEKGRNLNDDSGWDPFPSDIEVDPKDANNHVFVCHGQPATTEGDASAWDNQFWIQSPKSWKSGETLKIHFRYMASKDVKTQTQTHKQNPSDYLIWHAIGDIEFTTDWQTFDGNMTMGDDQTGGWSIAFNLNPNDKEAITFYFDDLQWQSMVLEEGFFVAGTNTVTGMPEYDFDNPVKFVESTDEEGCVEAYIGTKGDKSTYVNQIMISTVCGNTASFKSNTIKPAGDYIGEDAWGEYTESSLAKITLPAVGAWKIYLAPDDKQINILMLDGEEVQLADVVTNETNVVVKGLERDDLSDTAQGDNPQREEEGGTGETWDNQFFLVANRTLSTGEETVVKFQYKANKTAKTTTQLHGDPGAYKHWAAIGDVNFTEEWQDFEKALTIPSEANEMKSIAFNMAEIKEACDYELKNFQWYIASAEEGKTSENLIDATGTKNFYVKEGAGTNPHEFVPGGTGIENVAAKKANTAVIYNLAGQRVDNGFKGIVVKDGKKFVK